MREKARPKSFDHAANSDTDRGGMVELIWSGKYRSDGSLQPPPAVSGELHVVRRFDRAGEDDGFAPDRQPDNLLIVGDNLQAMQLLEPTHAGAIDLVYLDPPFATGRHHIASTDVGEGRGRGANRNLARKIAYSDDWDRRMPDYLTFMRWRLDAIRRLMSSTGSLYLHCDWRTSSMMRLVLDEVFGADCFQNEIVWCYREAINSRKRWNRKHDSILFYTRAPKNFHFDPDSALEPHAPATIKKYRHRDRRGPYRLMGRGIVGSPIRSQRDVSPQWEQTHPELVYRHYLRRGTYPVDYWMIDVINQAAGERTGWPTQKPESLLERIIAASSRPGDLVADFFCGSGTTLAVAERLNRRWLGCDVEPRALLLSEKRLLAMARRPRFRVATVRTGPSRTNATDLSRVVARLDHDGRGLTSVVLVDYEPAVDLRDGARVKTWSDHIDSWAVDWDWDGEVFRPGWLAQRTGRERSLPTTSEMGIAGARVAVRVVDVYGSELITNVAQL